ncbi:MAG: hypothetical protein HGA90_00220 [Alphaproteobacteria bacterium]|nr:hypothetical protein [Alphaproteobacteria bacterium]
MDCGLTPSDYYKLLTNRLINFAVHADGICEVHIKDQAEASFFEARYGAYFKEVVPAGEAEADSPKGVKPRRFRRRIVVSAPAVAPV